MRALGAATRLLHRLRHAVADRGPAAARGVLLAYYASQDDAARALRLLRRARFRRAALVARTAEGAVHIDRIRLRRRALWAFAGAPVGVLAGVLTSRIGGFSLGIDSAAFAAGFVVGGALAGWLLARHLGGGVDEGLIDVHRRMVVADEAVVILQEELERMGWAIPTLRSAGQTQPSIFAFHPPSRLAEPRGPRELEPLAVGRLEMLAERLAADHVVTAAAGDSEPLLANLEEIAADVERVRRDLSVASDLEQGIPQSAEWILDNGYIIQGHVDEVRDNLPRSFYHELPLVAPETAGGAPRSQALVGQPRVYILARELTFHTDGLLGRDNICAFLRAYQGVAPMTIGELWAMPLALRIALVESVHALTIEIDRHLRDRQEADFWANRLMAAARRDPDRLFSFLAELADGIPDPSAFFTFHLTAQLYDESAALAPVRGWVERRLGATLDEIVKEEQARQATGQVAISNAVTSLRNLRSLDWREIFEELSQVDEILRADPTGHYPQMDFGTRDRYRSAVEEIARGVSAGGAIGGDAAAREAAVARAAIKLATRPMDDRVADVRLRHVGHYLIGAGRPLLLERVVVGERWRRRVLDWVGGHATGLYLSSITGLTVLLAVAAALPALLAGAAAWQAALYALGLLPASQLAVQIVNYLVTRALPPRVLPKMSFAGEGIPDHLRTLVVVPVLLSDERTVDDELERLEVRFLANREPNLLFGLFGDLPDASAPRQEGDADLVQRALAGIEGLNERYGSGRFFLFQRDREWSSSERAFIGWERKRGKLEELNRLLCGEATRQEEGILRVGTPAQLEDVRFVITLDSDTQLPHDSARRLVETMAHPLNAPQMGGDGRVVDGGYGIIQPLVSSSLPSATATPFARLFTDPVGADPYTKAVSDVYQDLAGDASYQGKGIYDPRVFCQALVDRFPDNLLLSHDLLEGAHVRVGLASDIELFDEFPPDYLTHANREHRWIRGDWQIAAWCLPRVPDDHGGRVPNPLTLLNRWKIFDNLRRSLVAPVMVAYLMAAWLVSQPLAISASLLCAAPLLFEPLAALVTAATARGRGGRAALEKVPHGVLRGLAEAALLLHRAGLAMDAVARAAWRRLLSHRRLLEWTTSRTAAWDGATRPRFLVGLVGSLAVLGCVAAGVIAYLRPFNLVPAGPYLLLWLVSPAVAWRLARPPRPRPAAARLRRDRVRRLAVAARRTWRYFDDFVGEASSWLPPDNYQLSHRNDVAMRTSPTNIGLWLLSALAAHDLGFLTTPHLLDRLEKTFATLGRLERHRGHLLNWYDLEKLTPLEPRYVSTVDSGNLLACLWTLAAGLEELAAAPVLDGRALQGVRRTLDALDEDLVGIASEPEVAAARRRLAAICRAQPGDLPGLVGALREAASPAGVIARGLAGDGRAPRDAGYWARCLEQETAAWARLLDDGLGWVEALAEAEVEGAAGVPGALPPPPRAAPSLRELAAGLTAMPAAPVGSGGGTGELRDPQTARRARVEDGLERAKQWASRLLERLDRLAAEIRRFSDEPDMSFLYDERRRLFATGFNVSERRPDSSYYDLLASEARLSSFVAIARGDVSSEHWLALGRPYGAAGHRRVLLSWSGTMFEYLMPLLLQRAYPNSLLSSACRDAVTVQRAYGRRQGVPWGFSESAFGELDVNRTYQYRAFGVPALGFKRGLERDLVVAPYASLLALGVDPPAAVANLERLAAMGLRAEYGYFEAIDFTRHSSRAGEAGAVIRALMAHHQGMGLLALDNLLQDGVMQRRFHSDPRVVAADPLLYERIPVTPPLYRVETRERPAVEAPPAGVAPSVSVFDTPHTSTPRTQLLGNGRLAVLVTNSGGGYTRWRDLDVTRWRADTTRDHWGSFCYVRDLDRGRVWSTTHHPTGAAAESYGASFAMDRAEFQRVDDGIDTRTRVIVSPDDDVEIRRVTLINRSGHTRRLELTSYSELALAPHRADRQHPAFSKLFVQTEAVTGRGLLASRRPREPEEPAVSAAHLMVVEGAPDEGLTFETDRARFIGRGRTVARPAALEGPLSGTAGFVLDPVFSLRRTLTLDPGQRAQVSLVLAVAESREGVEDLMERYEDPRTLARAADLAWAHAQLELRLLRIQPDEARRFQQLASYMLYPSPRLRAPLERIAGNRLGQARLWAYGISGDLPIVVVTIADLHEISLVRQVLQAHTYWRRHGLKADLVILDEEASGYERPLRERLQRLIQTHSAATGVDQPGGVFLRHLDQIPPEDVALMLAVARVVLVAARGSLAQQLATPGETAELPPRLSTRPAREEPSSPLPFMELPYFNGLGGFTPDGREYAIYLGPGSRTPAPWVNVMANARFGAVLGESGSGFCWYGNSHQNRLVDWSNDPVSDPPADVIYIRDESSGSYWTPTPGPIREEDAYRARHGAGYTVFEHSSHAIAQELLTFVPSDAAGGDPCRVQRLRLTNQSSRRRRLSVTFYVEWTLGETREDSQMHVQTRWDGQVGALLARNRYNPSWGDNVAFAAISPGPLSHSGDRTIFLGRNRTPASPAAMERVRLAGRTGAGLDPCAALQAVVDLAPGQTAQVVCVLGEAESMEEVRRLVQRYRDRVQVEEALLRTSGFWDELLGAIQVSSPELSLSFMLNRWLLYQTLSCRVWGRSGFYQSAGAYGFRDQLQDVMALVYAAPEVAREQLLASARRQFVEGDVQHWWHPPDGAGIRSRIADDMLWLPLATAHYVEVTGDEGVLDEQVPFLEARPLQETEREAYLTPTPTRDSASLYEHCGRAVERAHTRGRHGLPLMGTGDWNDGMNRVGAEGRGESVWLAFFLAEVLERVAGLAERRGEGNRAEELRRRRQELLAAVEEQAWDGRWYRRAYFDDGTPLGSAGSPEGHIDSIAQSWAVISGGADGDRAGQALESAWQELVHEDESLVLLLTPPFDRSDPSPGYIQGYPPGVRENGGQYTHAAVWLGIALARRGDGERAARLLRLLNPVEHAREPADVQRYLVEPYVVAGDVYRLQGRVGRGGWTWYTGSAGWLYRAWIEELLGLQVRAAELRLDPVLPPAWPGFTLRFTHGRAVYEIEVENPDRVARGVVRVEMDGRVITGGVIPLDREAVRHRVAVLMGRKP